MEEKLRVVSLLASGTEIVCGLGCAELLVGISHECDFPAEIRALPKCTSPNINVESSSNEIDLQVKRSLAQGLSIYTIDESTLAELKPHIIITQSQCEVCAVSTKDVETVLTNQLAAELGFRPQIVPLSPNLLVDIWADVERVAEALGVPAKGREYVAGLQRRLDRIEQLATALSDKPRVCSIEWIEPLMTAGNWIPELIQIAGGINLFGEAGKHSPWFSLEQIESADPDIILVFPCGFDLDRTKQELKVLEQNEGWRQLRAVRESKVFLLDGNQYFNRSGPRVVESAEILAEIFHPELFPQRFKESAWLPRHFDGD